MQVEEIQATGDEELSADRRPNVDNRVSVEVEDTVGAIFLGILALTLLIALLRCEARARGLLARLQQQRAEN